MRAMQQLCALSKFTTHLHTCDINFGVASHFKNLCDGSQAHLRSALSECAAMKTMSDIPEMISRCAVLYSEYSADPHKPPRMPAEFHDFIPLQAKPEFEAEHMWQFTASSFREPISVSHAFQFRLNDIRRRKNCGFKN